MLVLIVRLPFTLVAVAFMAVQMFGCEAAAQSSDKKLLHAILAKNREGEAATKFRADSLKIYAFWKGDALKAGDTVRGVRIAEGIGRTALKDSKITEASTMAYKPDDDGIFSILRPKGGWPIGNYRCELYVGSKLAETLKFTIESDVTVEVH